MGQDLDTAGILEMVPKEFFEAVLEDPGTRVPFKGLMVLGVVRMKKIGDRDFSQTKGREVDTPLSDLLTVAPDERNCDC